MELLANALVFHRDQLLRSGKKSAAFLFDTQSIFVFTGPRFCGFSVLWAQIIITEVFFNIVEENKKTISTL